MAAIFTAANVLSRLIAIDGAGSGLDADLLDGQHGAWYADVPARLGYTPVNQAGDSFAGAVGAPQINLKQAAQAPRISLQQGEGARFWIGASGTALQLGGNGEDYVAGGLRVEYNGSMWSGGDRVWHAGCDGAGSGLDADLLDGQQGTDFLARRGAVANTAVDGAVVPGFYRLDLGSQSDALLAFDTPTSTGPVQMAFSYQGSFRWRSKVDSAFWTGWRTIWHTDNDGAGSGLDGDLLDGQQGSWYADVPARLGYTPANRAGDTFAGTIGAPQLNLKQAAQAPRISLQQGDGARFWIGASGTALQLGGNGEDYAAGGLRVEYNGSMWSGGDRMWHAGSDGAGSGLDADLLDGQQGSDYIARRGSVSNTTIDGAVVPGFYRLDLGPQSDALFTFDTPTSTGPVQMAFSYQGSFRWRSKVDSVSWTGWRTLWHTDNDGAGSGLDADLLDGWQRDDVRDWNNILNRPGAFPAAAHTHAAADIAGAFSGSLSGNGYTVLPNGLILQWVTGAQQAASSEGTQYVTFPIAFNTCFQVITSTQVANPNIESHAIYQLISFTAEGATVMRQLVSASGADREPSWPRLFAIGR